MVVRFRGERASATTLRGLADALALFVVRVRAELRGAVFVFVNKVVNSKRSSFRIWTIFALVFAHLNSFANIALYVRTKPSSPPGTLKKPEGETRDERRDDST